LYLLKYTDTRTNIRWLGKNIRGQFDIKRLKTPTLKQENIPLKEKPKTKETNSRQAAGIYANIQKPVI